MSPPPPPPPGRTPGAPPLPPLGKNGTTIGKANKLKRSPQMGKLYRLLRDEVEGKGSANKKTVVLNTASSGKAGLAAALADMAKRSEYFRKIEEDYRKFGSLILQIQSALVAFKTTNMTELLKFHQNVEDHLGNLSDESQVLSRFKGFPFEKLETLRLAAGTYHQLEGIVSTLKGWRFTAPSAQMPVTDQLDKIESYFKKIEKKVYTLERDKEKDAAIFQGQNLTFDYSIMTRIREEMVDVSSSCIEMALKESKQAKEAGKAIKLRTVYSATLWRVFQFVFTVYNFAGGQDDRADRLSSERACELQTYTKMNLRQFSDQKMILTEAQGC